MAVITFPRSKPDELLTAAGLSFILEPMIEVSPLRSGSQIAADLGPSLWRTDVRSTPLQGEALGIARAWIDTLSSLNYFYAYDQSRQFPVNYTTFDGLLVGASPFPGTCKIDTVASNNVEITLKELPISFKLRPGDYLSFDYLTGSTRALHRVVAGGDASGGGILTVEVRPHIRTGWVTNTVVTLYRAAAKMRVVPGSYSESISPAGVGEVSFKGIQIL